MRKIGAVLVLLGLTASPLAAQGRGRYADRSQGIPPGHLPPPGECRVWYDGRPAGHQPPPTSCREAERIASRDRYARVIYGSSRGDGRDDGWRERDDRRDRGRAIPRRDPARYPDSDRYPYPDSYPNRYPYPDNRHPYPERYPSGRDSGYRYNSVPFDNGYKDGFDKGREDARDKDGYDPIRHGRYRSGDHGYDRRYGSKDEYKNIYREGFRAGYDDGYRDTNIYRPDTGRSGIRLPRLF